VKLKAWYKPYQLQFKNPVLTSRGSMAVKNGYYLFISDGVNTGTGECSFIEGLSIDRLDNYEEKLSQLCTAIETRQSELFPDFSLYPSISFGYECALLDLQNGGKKILFESSFTSGAKSIPINGLVWMGNKDFMQQQIAQKLHDGFTCIKMKVGAIDFEEEVSLLEYIRKLYPKQKIEIRLDANGAFHPNEAFRKLEILSAYHIHSIEQPIKPGQPSAMKELCNNPPIPIALDEELIGPYDWEKASELLEIIRPQYIILKPSLLGGFKVCDMWIQIAGQNKIGWWATSALESNIGLNAIAQWVFTKKNPMVQGLGTGSLYTNNVNCPLAIEGGMLHYRKETVWQHNFAL
jgi:o-succinylbenzoate synthase